MYNPFEFRVFGSRSNAEITSSSAEFLRRVTLKIPILIELWFCPTLDPENKICNGGWLINRGYT